MKKAILSISVLFILFTFTCKKSEPVTAAQCSNTINTEYSAALNAWMADPTNTAKCKTVVDILGKLINCPGVAPATKAEYEKLLKDAPCSGL